MDTTRMAVTAALTCAVGLALPFAARTSFALHEEGAGPSGIKGAGNCSLHTFNADPSQVATVIQDYYKQAGAAAVPLNLPPVRPWSDYAVVLANESRLTNGAYAAIVSSDRVIRSLSHCTWPASGGAVMTTSGGLGHLVIVPYAVKNYLSRSSLMTIQNTDPNQRAPVTIKLYTSGTSVPIVTKQYTIEKGTSITLDLGTNADFDLVPPGLVGWMSFESATVLAASAFVDYANSERGVSAVAGLPVDRAATELVVPFVGHAAPMVPTDPDSAKLDSFLAIVNPGTSPVQATVHYQGSGGSCVGSAYDHPEFAVPAGASAIVYQGAAGAGVPTGASGLPAGCSASARLKATGGSVVATVFHEQSTTPGGAVVVAAGHEALPVGDAGTVVHLPYIRRRQEGMTSAVWVMNTGDAVAHLTLVPSEAEPGGQPVPCDPGCTADVAPQAATVWWLDDLTNFGLGRSGFATVSADQPIVAVVLDVPETGAYDLSAYLGSLASPSPAPSRLGQEYVPFLFKARADRPTLTPVPTPSAATPILPTATATQVPPTATPRPPDLFMPFAWQPLRR